MVCYIDGCEKAAQDSRYLLDDNVLCDKHYSGYLVKLIDSFCIDISTERSKATFDKYKNSLKFVVVPIDLKSEAESYSKKYEIEVKYVMKK